MRSETEMAIRGFGPIERPESARSIAPALPGNQAGPSFVDEMGKAVGQLDRLQLEGDQQAQLVADGGGNLHEMAIALEKADVAMKLAMKVRNKVVDAYNEIMRMGV